MCMAEVSRANSESAAFRQDAHEVSLGMTGGSSQPIGTYSRLSELTSRDHQEGATPERPFTP